MKLIFCLVFVAIAICQCSDFLDSLNRIKNILKKYSDSQIASRKLQHLVHDTMSLASHTVPKETFSSYNVTQCDRRRNNAAYQRQQTMDGLLVHENVSDQHWQEYKRVHNKVYKCASHEEAARSTWLQNLARVASHNRRYLQGGLGYSLHLNHFGDLSPAEYFNKILKLKILIPWFDPAHDTKRTSFHRATKKKIPTHVDWRARGFRPRLQEQWRCGACYALAVSHAVQAQLFRNNGTWEDLSAQQIVDCSVGDGNDGCDGGSLSAALTYTAREGLETERHYPYTGKKGSCRHKRNLSRVRPRRWATLPRGSETAIERTLATIGPVLVGLNAEPFTFQLYRSGVYDDWLCTSWKLNHAMLLVGYTPQYWVLLNWWGEAWGENGYMRMKRGLNRCGITNMAFYVEL